MAIRLYSALLAGAVATTVASTSNVAQAANVAESSLGMGAFDAGQLIPGAPDVGIVPSPTSSISGRFDTRLSLNNGNSNPDLDLVDLFKITLNVDSLFQAEADVNPGGGNSGRIVDPQLFLFDSSGQELFRDDDSGPGLDALIQANLTAGMYFLGITPYNVDPVFTAGALSDWNGSVLGSLDNPTNGDANTNNLQYRIGLSASPTAVPTPALLPGLLGFGMSIVRKRKKQQESLLPTA